jgi:hypothetical protein
MPPLSDLTSDVRTASCFFTRTTHRRHTHASASLSRARRARPRARVPRSARGRQARGDVCKLFLGTTCFSGLTFQGLQLLYSDRRKRRRFLVGQRIQYPEPMLNVGSDHPCSSSMSLLDMGHVSHDLFCIDVRHAWPHTTVSVMTDSGASRHASHGRVSHVTSDISVGSDVTSTKPSHHSHTGLTHLTTLHCDKARRPGRGFHTTRLTRPAP